MNWWGLFSLFMFATFKFMFAPLPGPKLELSFIETYFACAAGAIFSSAIFYYSASYFMQRAADKRQKKKEALIAQGKPYKQKRSFTRMNKFIVRIKRSIGIIGISFWAPFFLSIPIGSIVAAKFYGGNKKTYLLIVLGIFLNGAITTGITYLSYG